jgi:plastocyanin
MQGLRFGFRVGIALIAVSALALFGACKGSTDTAQQPDPTVDPGFTGSVKVEVLFTGTPPEPQALNLASAPQCAAAHPEPVYDQSVVVQNGKLVNAVVWIKSGMGARRFAAPTEPVVIDQRGCIYHPHVAAAMIGQPVQFVNSDPEPHNVHGRPNIVSSWNFMMSRKNSMRTLTFDKEEVAIEVGCDIHPWMRAYLAVVGHPYFGVTTAGSPVVLSGVPVAEYVVGVWHEKLGLQEQRVTVLPQETATLTFKFEG